MELEMVEVWRLAVVSGLDNTYGVDRKETWKLVLETKFGTELEAKHYIKMRTRTHVDTCGAVGPWLLDKTEEEKDRILDQFCFSNATYLPYRRFFLGKPTSEEVIRIIKAGGQQHEAI